MGYLLFIAGAILVILGKLGVIPNIEYTNMVGQSVSTLGGCLYNSSVHTDYWHNPYNH